MMENPKDLQTRRGRVRVAMERRGHYISELADKSGLGASSPHINGQHPFFFAALATTLHRPHGHELASPHQPRSLALLQPKARAPEYQRRCPPASNVAMAAHDYATDLLAFEVSISQFCTSLVPNNDDRPRIRPSSSFNHGLQQQFGVGGCHPPAKLIIWGLYHNSHAMGQTLCRLRITMTSSIRNLGKRTTYQHKGSDQKGRK